MEKSPLNFRNDIQGLRGLAVAFVVIYHIWPSVLRGGYVGVDIFFVISGYLITSILIKEASDRGSINVLRFYVHRIARLVPAATIALVACAIVVVIAFPVTRWRDTGIDIVGSALYMENWVLARRSVNYLNAYLSPSIAQHFWSLSVEGQFYLVWPFILATAYFLRRRLPARLAPNWGLLLSLLTVALFLLSLELFRQNPGLAYFSTFTRLWEMTLGGAAAYIATPGRSSSLYRWLRIAAVLAMAGSAVWFDNLTPFPGVAALLPTFGAAVFLYAGNSPATERDLFSSRPMVYLGDISYSLYLWHWPLLISANLVFGEPLGMPAKFLLIAATLAISHVSTNYIERPARRRIVAALDRPRRLFLAVSWPVASVAAGLAIFMYARTLQNRLPGDFDLTAFSGARALQADAANLGNTRSDFLPAPIAARYDRDEDCLVMYSITTLQKCSIGPASAKLRIALVGDSHAMQWLPTLREIVKRHDVAVTAYAKASCPFATTMFLLGQESRVYSECAQWREAAVQDLKQDRPDIVLIASINRYALPEALTLDEINRQVTEGFVRTLQDLRQANLQIAIVRDTPFLPFDMPDCVAARWRADCSAIARDVFKAPEPLFEAAKQVGGIAVIDLTNKMCPDGKCVPVVGNVLVFRDSNHLTASYARTLADDFYEQLPLAEKTPRKTSAR